MSLNQRLELTWIEKEKEMKVEPRILLEIDKNSCGDIETENKLIHGDNLLALKALEQEYAGKIKCIYIDPPYNTGSAFEHYDDNLEHSMWLSLMKARLEILYRLLSQTGSIWISIDADESHYLKVVCDEIFGRKNFIDEITWQRAFSPVNLKKTLSRSTDCILVYAKNLNSTFEFNKLERSQSQLDTYKNLDNDERGPWTSSDCTVGPVVKEKLYDIITPSGRIVRPSKGRCWLFTKERFEEMKEDNRIWFGTKGNNMPRVKKFISEVREGVVPVTLWLRDEVGDNQEAKKEVKAFGFDSVFDTPKPERLIQRILQIATDEGDIVLDSFLGSGTTAAVAHKMKRRWIGIELGDHCYTHCIPRLKKVIEGEQGGISKQVNWKGGGGFKFYELAPSLLKQDRYGNLIINTDIYTANMVAEAVAKYHGFTYLPDQEVCWKQGYSFEKDYIFTTDQPITTEYIDLIHSEMQSGESLLICCPAYQPGVEERYENINVQKIPQSILDKYDFGVESYSMNMDEVAMAEVAATLDEEE